MEQTWLSERPHLTPLVERVQALLELADEAHQRGRSDGDSVDYGAFEERVSEATAELERAVHHVALSSLDVDAPFVCVWGKHYRRVHRTERAYSTMAGPVPVLRTLYREVGKRSGPSLDPVGTRAGVVDGSWLPRTARAVAHLVALGTSREAQATSQELMRLPYSRSSFERVGHAVGSEYLKRRQQVEPKLIEAYEVPEETRSISVSIDRVSVPMEEPILRKHGPEPPPPSALLSGEVKRKYNLDREIPPRLQATLDEQEREARRKPPRKIERNYRMAYCATVTLHDKAGEALHTIRYGRMPPQADTAEYHTHRDVHRLMERLRDDVISLRCRVSVPVVLLADGAPEVWNLLDRYLCERTLGVKPERMVDAWHVMEYVAAAARLLEGRGKAWPGTFRRWKETLLKEPGGAEKILKEMKEVGCPNLRDQNQKQPVKDAIRYIGNRLAQLDYAGAKKRGLPIGSGAVEATCKSLVNMRMKRAGSRWKRPTGNEILQLRALQLSDRWDAAMPMVLKSLRKPVAIATREEAMGKAA